MHGHKTNLAISGRVLAFPSNSWLEILFVVVVKLDFEIAVDQQTKANDQNVEGVLDSGCPKIWQPNSEICRAFLRIWPPNFVKGLTQNSTPKLKVEIKIYGDSKNFMKNIEFYYF